MRSIALWLDPICTESVTKAISEAGEIPFTGSFETLIDAPPNPPPQVIICGHPPEELKLVEVAQMLGLTFADAKLIHLTSSKAEFNREILKKNGFTDAFLLPFECFSFEKFVKEVLAHFGAAKEQTYRSVNLVDFQGDDPLEFDTYIYLPLNSKHVRLSSAGKNLRPEQIKKLKSKDVGALRIKQEDMGKFFQFTAQQLSMMGKAEGISETEKKEKLQSSVRMIVGGVFAENDSAKGFDNGRKILGDCHEIVKAYVKSSVDQAVVYDQLTSLARERGDTYSKAINISTLAGLFSIGIQVGVAEDIALAGLLCDLGVAELPPEIQSKPADQRTPDEEKHYMRHPKYSIEILQAQRVMVTENVAEMVLQHHEHYDGTGHPFGMKYDKINVGAQLLAIAEEIDERMAISEGKARLHPREAFEALLAAEAKFVNGHRFNPDLLRRVSALILTDVA